LGPLVRHLTLREKQIVELVGQAKLNKEIAYHLHLTEGTIKEYLNKIFRKLGVKNRTELAIWSLANPSQCRWIAQKAGTPYPQVSETVRSHRPKQVTCVVDGS